MWQPAVQLRWDERVVRAEDSVQLSITIPASFLSVIAWWRFRDVLRGWEDERGEVPVAQLDSFWLARQPARAAPQQIVISAFADALADDGFRWHHALHEAAIAIDPA